MQKSSNRPLYHKSLIIDDGDDHCVTNGNPVYNWFENPAEQETGIAAYPINIFINHKMQIHKLKFSAPPAIANIYIQQMIDNLETELSANYKNITPFNFQITNLFPNPFNPVLNIDFEISQAGWVKVEISDITGAIVNIVYDGYMTMGKHQKSWNSENLPSGTYFVTLEFENSSLTKKVVLLK